MGEGSNAMAEPVKLAAVNETEATLLRRGFEAVLDRLADLENRPPRSSCNNSNTNNSSFLGPSTAVLSRWPLDTASIIDEIRSHTSQKNRIRNVRFFARMLGERDKLRHQQGTLLEEVQHELPRLHLPPLLRLRLLQGDAQDYPDSCCCAQRFMVVTDNLLYQRIYEDFIGMMCTGSQQNGVDKLAEYLRHLRGSAATAVRRSLAKDVLVTLGVARTVCQTGWWRVAFPIRLMRPVTPAVPPTSPDDTVAVATPVEEPPPPVRGVIPVPSGHKPATPLPLGSAEIRERSSKRLQLARSRSVEAMRSQFQQHGTAIVDVFVGLPDLVITTTRPVDQEVYLAHNPDLCLRGGVLNLEVWRVPPQTSLTRFFRPQDFNIAMQRELRKSIHARAVSVSRLPAALEVPETQESQPTTQGSPPAQMTPSRGGPVPLMRPSGSLPPSTDTSALTPLQIMPDIFSMHRRMAMSHAAAHSLGNTAAAASPSCSSAQLWAAAAGKPPSICERPRKDLIASTTTDCSDPPTQQAPLPQHQPGRPDYSSGSCGSPTASSMDMGDNKSGFMDLLGALFRKAVPASGVAAKDGGAAPVHPERTPGGGSPWGLSTLPVGATRPTRAMTTSGDPLADGGRQPRLGSEMRTARRSGAQAPTKRMESPSVPPPLQARPQKRKRGRRFVRVRLPEVSLHMLELQAALGEATTIMGSKGIPITNKVPTTINGRATASLLHYNSTSTLMPPPLGTSGKWDANRGDSRIPRASTAAPTRRRRATMGGESPRGVPAAATTTAPAMTAGRYRPQTPPAAAYTSFGRC